jgi:nucleoside-diphosphate-sugar epimerase
LLRIFIAGGTGVIGRRVVPALVSAGYHVTAASRTHEGRARLAAQGAEPVAMNMYDEQDVSRAVGKQDVVINLATHIPSSTTKMLFPSSWRENDQVRRVGSKNIVIAARSGGADCVIQESFAGIYEDGGDKWIDEKWAVRPTRYNRTVLDAENSAAQFTKWGGRGIVLRFANFYGPDGFVTREMVGMVRKGVSPLLGPNDAYWSSISHDDAATAVVEALHAPAGIYNVSDDEPLERGEWIASLAKALGVGLPRPIPWWLAKLGGSTAELLSRSQRLSNKKLHEVTDWRPAVASVRDAWPRVVDEISRGATT